MWRAVLAYPLLLSSPSPTSSSAWMSLRTWFAAPPSIAVSATQLLTPRCLPFGDRTFEAITVASSIHWFNQDRFLREAQRLLRADGWMAVYDHFFLGRMDGEPSFAKWVKGSYNVRYPPPPRGPHLFSTEQGVVLPGFEEIASDSFSDPIPMTHEHLVDYLLTQSNTIAAVNSAREPRNQVRGWLTHETRKFFSSSSESRTLHFWATYVCFSPRR